MCARLLVLIVEQHAVVVTVPEPAAGWRQGSLEATQGHVVLRGVEAAQAHVVPQLSRVDTTLQQSLVKAKRDLRLISVEVVARNRGN